MSWFDDWATRHATIFGLDAERMKTVLSWEPLFMAAGYTMAELNGTTDWLAMNAPPKFWPEHLPAITGRIRDLRAVEYRTEVDPLADRGTCTTCGGTGRVVVPHVAGIVEGRWVPIAAVAGRPQRYTMAVWCRCALGKWVEARSGRALENMATREMRPMGLDEYEGTNPRWRVQMADHERELQERSKLAGPMSREWTELVERLRRRYISEEP